MYTGLSYPDRPFSIELDSVEINTQIQGILDDGADQDPSPSQSH
jgi:hypothetical protein